MARQIRISLAWVAAAACLAALAGCGGDSSPNLTAEVTQLEEDLAAAQQQLVDLQEEAETEEEEETPAPTPPRTLADAAGDPQVAPRPPLVTTPPADDDTDDTDTVVAPPAPPVPTGPSAEDVRRAHGILAALQGATPTFGGEAGADLAPTIAVENGRITIERGAFEPMGSPISQSGFHGVLLHDSLPHMVDDTDTWAIYTDIERTRGILEHHDIGRRRANEPSEFALETADLNRMYSRDDGRMADIFSISGVGTTTDGARRVTLTPDDDPNMVGDTLDQVTIRRNPGGQFSATYRGTSGSFVCEGTAACEFTIDLAAEVMGEPRVLGVDGFSIGDGWVFDAGSQRQIPIPGGDTEFIYYGWWLRTPASSAGTYMFEPRLGGLGLVESPTFSGEARYTGPATGRYVQQDSAEIIVSDGDPLTLAESGFFTAQASLVANSEGVSGSVGNFREDGQGLGDWTVVLNDVDNTTVLRVGDTPGEMHANGWAVRFAPSRATGENPVSVVGHFEAVIPNSLHILGAFGANRQ